MKRWQKKHVLIVGIINLITVCSAGNKIQANASYPRIKSDGMLPAQNGKKNNRGNEKSQKIGADSILHERLKI